MKGGGDICDCLTASLGNKVWNDSNGNGLQDAGETVRAGVRVELYEVNNAKLGLMVASQTTDQYGNYLFSELPPGDYAVRFIAPEGTMFTSANMGLADEIDSDADPTSGFTGIYTLNAGDRNTTVDAGLIEKECPTTPNPDAAQVCEDRSTTFNVLANDLGVGLTLINVAHESAALDVTFKSKGGVISFNAQGDVTYQSMANYYGFDKLVYTLRDASGKTFTQTVDIEVQAVSDAPNPAAGAAYHPGGWETSYVGADKLRHWVHGYTLNDFGPFKDSADALQQFGTYNKDHSVADDTDKAAFVRLYGLTTNAGTADILFDGKVLDFSAGQTYDIALDDIKAGKLDLDFHKAYVTYSLKFAWVDSGSEVADADCQGSIVSTDGLVKISTPVALDLNGDGHIGVTGATSSSQKDTGAPLGHTVQFDIDGDGKADTIERFDGSGDGILVDNRDGLVGTQMDGTRLFGNDNGAFSNGYDKLAQLDVNGDGRLDGSELQGLLVWVDNGDAQVQDGELRTLGAAGIAAVSTQMHVTVDDQGRGHLESSATRVDGSELMSEDVFFARVEELPSPCDVIAGGDHTMDSLIGAAVPETAALAQAADVHDVSEAAELLRKIGAALHWEAAPA
ncbi:MAG: cadherin-like domain-containing protein [Proteobacteria bacterium]|nr:cadherin-like domain-containing protein [Pseudomonadota bacterium]